MTVMKLQKSQRKAIQSKNEKEALDKYTASTVTYEKLKVPMRNLTQPKILDMLSISDDGNVNIDDAKVTKYVQQLASKYNTFGRKRSFKTSSGDTIEIGGGDYGWVVSKEKRESPAPFRFRGRQASGKRTCLRADCSLPRR